MKIEELRKAFDQFFKILEGEQIHFIPTGSDKCVYCRKNREEAKQNPCIRRIEET